MAILKISRLGHPVLLQKAKSVKDLTGNGVKQIIHDMTETMLDAKGIGLAAPQIYINKQIIIFRNLEEEKEKDDLGVHTMGVTHLVSKMHNRQPEAMEEGVVTAFKTKD